MADPGSGAPTTGGSDGEIPFLQRLLDNMWLLLLLGFLSPTIIYTVWGVMDVIAIPPAP